MTAQSGFLDSFLKFLKGDESEPLTKPIKLQPHIRIRNPKPKKAGKLPPEKVKKRPGRPRKYPKVTDKIEKEKCNSESDEVGSSTEVASDTLVRPRKHPKVKDKIEKEKFNSETDEVGSLAEVANDLEASDTLSRPQKHPKVKDKIENEKFNSETDEVGSLAEVANDLEASDTLSRPRKHPKVRDKIEKEKFNSESDEVGSSAEVANDFEPTDTLDSDSLSMSKNMVLEVLKENFNNCVNEKVECEETNGVKEIVKKKDFDCLNEENTQDNKSITGVLEDQNDKTEENRVDLTLRSDQRKNSIDEASNCSEKEKQDSVISNLTDGDENLSRDGTSESTSEESKSRKRKRKKKTEIEEQVPRRELSARKAKQKVKFSYIESESEDNPGFEEESNSDDDPVWVPNEKKASSDEEDTYGWNERQMANWKSKKVRSISPTRSDLKQNDEKEVIVLEAEADDETMQNRNTSDGSSGNKEMDNGVDVKKTSSTTRTDLKDNVYQYPTQMPFQSGSFIALKKELEDLEEPTLWRVDGKALLQKYEPYRGEDGSLKYRNVSTYSGWGPKNRALYQPVPVRFLYQNRFENIVEIVKEELVINEDKLREKLVKDLEKHIYAYEVYLQTLVSQALDTNFLSEIVSEKDEYFITSVEEMDHVCEDKKKKLLQVFGWTDQLKESLCKWPTLIVKAKDKQDPDSNCQVCCKFSYFASVSLEGETYSNQTLECLSPDTDSCEFKTFLACKTCLENIQLFNQIAHLKYHTYNVCIELVFEKKASDENKDNTNILHDILADGPYIKKKFHEVTLLWAQADLKSRKKKPEEVMM